MLSPPVPSAACRGVSTSRHPCTTLFWVIVIVVIALGDNIGHTAAAEDRVFTDSRGQVFTWSPGDGDNANQPRIVLNAKGALSLFHLGMSEEKFVGVYDSWKVVDLDASSGGNKVLIPSAEERAFLESAPVNLTPQCSTQTPMDDSCDTLRLQFDAGVLAQVEYDFIIAQGIHQRDLVPKEAEIGHKIIWINERFQPHEGCYSESPKGDAIVFDETVCEANSLIDSVRLLETFATFLGIDPTPEVLKEQQAMCQTAANFVEHAQDLHQRGIYVAAGSIDPWNGGTLSVFAPSSYPWLRTLEELGLPLLHPPREQDTLSVSRNYLFIDWFPDCNASDKPLDKCSELATTALPVDFWLWWTPVYERLQESAQSYEDICSQIPDPALTAQQYSFFVSDGAAAISYTNIRRFLEAIQESTAKIVRVHRETIVCTDDLVVKSAEYNTPGGDNALRVNEGGGYNCFDQDHLQGLYLECPALEAADLAVPSDNTVTVEESVSSSRTSKGDVTMSVWLQASSATVAVAIVMYTF